MKQTESPKRKTVTVTLEDDVADTIKGLLKILKVSFEAQEEMGICQPMEAKFVQKLMDKLDHRLDQDGKPTGLWL
jgi:hypothetical protein|tara:strand:- start:861 stop:1085 length:225 start_codon:yes stop_codon:yes gene_type:complete